MPRQRAGAKSEHQTRPTDTTGQSDCSHKPLGVCLESVVSTTTFVARGIFLPKSGQKRE